MGLEEGTLFWRSVFGIHVALIVCERHLGVDNYVAVVGEMQDEVWNQAFSIIAFQTLAALVFQRLLGVILFTLLQLQVFQQLLQFQLAEVSLYLHFTCQGSCQTIGCLANGLTLLHINLDGLVQSGQCLRLLLLGLVKGFLHVFQTPLQRVDNLRHLFLVLYTQLLLTHLQHLL